MLKLSSLAVGRFCWGWMVHPWLWARLIAWANLTISLFKQKFVEIFKDWFAWLSFKQIVVDDVLCMSLDFLLQKLRWVLAKYLETRVVLRCLLIQTLFKLFQLLFQTRSSVKKTLYYIFYRNCLILLVTFWVLKLLFRFIFLKLCTFIRFNSFIWRLEYILQQ